MDQTNGKRVLVAYGSKHGATAEIAARVGDRIRAGGLEVDVCEAGEVKDVEPYGAVVLGSAVYMGRWSRDARKLLTGQADELTRRETWLFSSGPVGEDEEDLAKAERWTTPKLVKKMGPKIGAHEHVVFGGRVPLDPGNFMERAMERDTKPELKDRRDWQAIEAWADGIARTLA
jgi:menaquinone-dependent protoporphyrinogen oxidase